MRKVISKQHFDKRYFPKITYMSRLFSYVILIIRLSSGAEEFIYLLKVQSSMTHNLIFGWMNAMNTLWGVYMTKPKQIH